MIEELMKNLNKELENIQVPVDQQLVTPWLHITHWHEFVAGSGFSTDLLCQGGVKVLCRQVMSTVEKIPLQMKSSGDFIKELISF